MKELKELDARVRLAEERRAKAMADWEKVYLVWKIVAAITIPIILIGTIVSVFSGHR